MEAKLFRKIWAMLDSPERFHREAAIEQLSRILHERGETFIGWLDKLEKDKNKDKDNEASGNVPVEQYVEVARKLANSLKKQEELEDKYNALSWQLDRGFLTRRKKSKFRVRAFLYPVIIGVGCGIFWKTDQHMNNAKTYAVVKSLDSAISFDSETNNEFNGSAFFLYMKSPLLGRDESKWVRFVDNEGYTIESSGVKKSIYCRAAYIQDAISLANGSYQKPTFSFLDIGRLIYRRCDDTPPKPVPQDSKMDIFHQSILG